MNEYHLETNTSSELTLISYGINDLPKGNIGNKNYGFFSFYKFYHRVQQSFIHNVQCNILRFSPDNYYYIAGFRYMLTHMQTFCFLYSKTGLLEDRHGLSANEARSYPNMMKYQGLCKAFSTFGFYFR